MIEVVFNILGRGTDKSATRLNMVETVKHLFSVWADILD